MNCKVFLSKKIAQRISRGHNWVFDHEIAHIEGDPEQSGVVHVFTHTGSFLGIGFYNRISKIAIRILSRKGAEMSVISFFQEKIEKAFDLRKQFSKIEQVLRLFNSESDGISGLFVEKYQSNIVVQFLTRSLQYYSSEIIEIIKKNISDDSIKIQIDASNALRRFEELPVIETIESPFTFEFEGVMLNYDNRLSFSMERRQLYQMISMIARNKNIWDICCGTGTFSKLSIAHHSNQVLSIDNEATHIHALNEWIKEHSNTDRWTVLLENAFDGLKTYGKKYFIPDIIILDPPAFNVQSQELNPYKNLIACCMKQIANEGILIVGYQSAQIESELFWTMLKESAYEQKRELILINRIQSSLDSAIHPMYSHHLSFNFWVLKVQDF